MRNIPFVLIFKDGTFLFSHLSSMERDTLFNVLVPWCPLTIYPADPDHQMLHTEGFSACSLQGSY